MNSIQPMSHPISFKKAVLLLVGCSMAFSLGVADAQLSRAPEAQAFLAAAASGNEVEIRQLLKIGIPVDCTNDTGGQTALMLAAAWGDVRVVAELLSAGADLEQHDRAGATALMDAVIKGKREASKFLIRRGADVNARTALGMTPLMMSVMSDQIDGFRSAPPIGCEDRGSLRGGNDSIDNRSFAKQKHGGTHAN